MGKSSNLPAKKYSAGQRSQIRLSFEGSGDATQFIDVGLSLSAVNQRHSRSGLYYYIESIEYYDNSSGYVDIHTLPDTFTVKNAWNRAFQHYMKMNRLAGDTPRGKWHDFRVYMSNLHRNNGSLGPSLHGVNAADAAVAIDEGSLYSMMTTADDDGDETQEADNFYLHFLGDHVGSSGNWTSVGIIKSYDDVKQNISVEPAGTSNDAETDPLANMFDFSSEEMINDIIDNIENYGNSAPYDMDAQVGSSSSHMQQQCRLVTQTGINRVAKASGFCAPYGLICIDPESGVTSDWRVVINLVAGPYHGVYAERSI